MGPPWKMFQAFCCMVILVTIATPAMSQTCATSVAIDLVQIGNGHPQCSGYPTGLEGAFFCGDIDDDAAELICRELGINYDADGNKAFRCKAYEGSDGNNIDVSSTDVYEIPDIGLGGDRCTNVGPDESECFYDCYDVSTGAGSTCGTPYVFAITCHDIDECTEKAHTKCKGPSDHDCPRKKPCGIKANCDNTPGSYTCTCPDNYNGAGSDPKIECFDTNECTGPDPPCGIDECMNIPGSYTCQCTAGREWTGEECENVECDPPAAITNAALIYPPTGGVTYNPLTLDAAATYRCNDGYTPSHAGEEDDITFKLDCRPDGEYCPCTLPRCERATCKHAPYDPNAHIDYQNGVGGPGKGVTGDTAFYTCLKGYGPDYSRVCQPDGSWTDPTGLCEDIDECLNPTQYCSSNSVCYNTIGYFVCVCNSGYTGSGTIGYPCTPISCGEVPTIGYGERLTMLTADIGTFGMEVRYKCKDGYQTARSEDHYVPVTEFSLVCRADGIWEPNPLPKCVRKSCGDPGLIKYADRKGTSFKFRDEVQYRCAPGFRPTSVWDSNSAYNTITITCELNGWNGRAQCEDINECEKDYACGIGNHHCINTPGSFRCSCDKDYKLSEDGKCVGFPGLLGGGPDAKLCDIYTKYNICPYGTCEMHDGVPSCKCQDGYHGPLCETYKKDYDDYTARNINIISMTLSSVLLVVTVLMIVCLCMRLPPRHRQVHDSIATEPIPPFIQPRYRPRPAHPGAFLSGFHGPKNWGWR